MRAAWKELQPKKVAVALFCGWLALLATQFPIVLDNVYDTQFIWQLVFPMLVATAWEPVYAYITGIGGLVFLLPFGEMPGRGLGNLLIGLLYLLLLLVCGHFCNRGKRRCNYYLVHVLYAAFYFVVIVLFYKEALLHNPPGRYLDRFISPVILRVQAITVVFCILALAAFVKVLISQPAVRKLLWMPPLAYSDRNSSLFFISFMVAFGFFIVDGFFEAFYFESRGIHTSLLSSSFGQIIKLPIVFAVACMICDAIISSTMRSQESHDKLMKSEERYRMIFQHTADAYFEIDADGVVLNVNPAIYTNLGFTPGYILGQHISLLFHDKEEINGLLTRLFTSEQVTNIEIKGMLSNRMNCSLLVSGNVMRLGKQRLAVITARNISDYKKAEEKRWELSALLNAIFESNKDFIWTVDCRTFALISFNQAFSHYIRDNFGRAIRPGSALEEVFSGEDQVLFAHYYRQVLEKGDFSVEYTALGGALILNLNFYPVKLNRDIASIAVFTKDVTAQKRAERKIVELNAGLEQTVEERTQELRTAYHDLESFSYTVTHEFKTPIREIDAYLEIIQEDNYDTLTAQSKEDILSAKKVCTQTLDMIQKMMIYTKAGFMVLNIEKIDMKKLVLECFNDIQQANESKNLELELYELPSLYADRFLMRVAVMNVMSNSIKFSQTRERIALVAGYMSGGGQVTYYFKDNGVGFERALGNNLFELFNRAHNSSEYEGSGIGLALVKRILNRHGGQVGIVGEAGRGCVVFFTFQHPATPRLPDS
ncbi:sensor histidine kinase [Anaerotruncus rubiinfantis]|uniref:sensor histidine kinase n=1 Tax=Anaerotruncus rubiinfantis TaxID=1720200 RepID=UPI00189B23BE|nr:PAS domain S-box protein [Anaerotruncus rubiinfantis]